MILRSVFLFFLFSLPRYLFAQQNIVDSGVRFFLSGDIDNAINSFRIILKNNPSDNRIREVLKNCLILKAKKMIENKQYSAGIKILKEAESFSPDDKEMQTLRLTAELENKIPVGEIAVSSLTLQSPLEIWSVFDCIFDIGKCASYNKYLIHIVSEGETMSTIADKYYKDYKMWEKIWKANPKILNPHRLEKGTRLVIPLD